ncbi:MAG: copper amine oxidase N-terminal domain-containing protein [Clostridia bacterium]|jgi:archaellum component FlaG (FlaF/FlaG flagellin family)|nr:copper amine oxidase N-terminal domain-containing protein [Clostridia bacterium]MCI1998974.1 copper amine oxidase N-terminal domain-containing protein [Clostridia bacterium]MCI2013724.1 copper amine oxidase N-terminal domain-containing protein [Clostridia bacterium]
MKNFKTAAAGFVAGALCMVTVTAMAAYSDVTAKLWNDVTFRFNNERVASPSDQPVLNYRGYTYVPLRFVSEQFGADVNYDSNLKTVSVDYKPKVVEKQVPVVKEVPVYIKDDSKTDGSAVYQTLPIKVTDGDYSVEVTGFTRNASLAYTKALVTVKNKGDDYIQLVPSESKLTVDGEDVPLCKILSRWDNSWSTGDIYSEDDDDGEKDGYVSFELCNEDYEKMDLTLVIRNNTTGEDKPYTFHFIEKGNTSTDDDD